jgi:hypothetical protein
MVIEKQQNTARTLLFSPLSSQEHKSPRQYKKVLLKPFYEKFCHILIVFSKPKVVLKSKQKYG